VADNRSTLMKRVISAVTAGFVVLGLGYFGHQTGLYIVCSIAIVLGVREYSRMAFRHWQMPASVTNLYWLASVLFYVLAIYHGDSLINWFSLSNILFFTGTLWLTRSAVNNDQLLPALAVGTFGMVYCVLFPFFAVRLVMLEQGAYWFSFLLILVFAGDTFAYFGGRFAGRHKLMPQISPNKTIEGAVAGLAGSALCGVLFVLVTMPQIPWWKTLAFCLVCGFVAQSGDLLVSLVKRVADVKDSGQIMPGHGGILDRLDGIFIASPLVYTFAFYVV
jgi:phosphatidate cytidylyltransferase